jgi:carboxylesterase type B
VDISIVEKVPVLVFIHGGSFETGSGSLPVLNGEYLSRKLGSLVVTFNYRLSIFGFAGIKLSNYHLENPGFADQSLAIRYIQKYIAFFGGDVNNITLFGQSAGALSAIVQAKFHSIRNLILSSPPAIKFTPKSHAQHFFNNLTNALECGVDLIEDCFEKSSFRDILDAQETVLMKSFNEFKFNDFLRPVEDSQYLIKHPFDMIKDLKGVNIMLGTTMDETFRIIQLSVPVSIDKSMADIILNVMIGKKDSARLNDLYNPAQSNDYRNYITKVTTDYLFVCPTREYAARSSSFSNIFIYDWQDYWTGGSNDPIGRICSTYACHTTDLVFLFNPVQNQISQQRSEVFKTYFAEFIKYGHPGSVGTLNWDPISSDYIPILTIPSGNSQIYLNTNITSNVCNYWNQNEYQFHRPEYSNTFQREIHPLLFLSILFLFLLLIGIQIILLIVTKFRRTQFYINITKLYTDKENKQPLELDIYLQKRFNFTPNPTIIEIKNLVYEVEVNGLYKKILNNIDCEFKPGLTAIMGVSGSGKSTLVSLVHII